MEDLHVFENITIKSQNGYYNVEFFPDTSDVFDKLDVSLMHFVIDKKVAHLYEKELGQILLSPNTILIDSSEENKSIERIIDVIRELVENKVRRGQSLCAIGGGIVQDIVCFIAATLFRGLEWSFVPTTLVAQADSCIGSKSSVNLGSLKNILGTFNPPKKIFLCPRFLETLEKKEIQSGIGEILKVQAIAGKKALDDVINDFEKLLNDKRVLSEYIHASLTIKKKYIEIDEFDKSIRNIFNYGHSFGHAIETATNFQIPHGVAVSMGMDLANHVASQRGLVSRTFYTKMHKTLLKNYRDFRHIDFSIDNMLSALKKDKKNTAQNLVLILPVGENAEIKKVELSLDDAFITQCQTFFETNLL